MAIALITTAQSPSGNTAASSETISLNTSGSSNVAVVVLALAKFNGSTSCTGVTYNGTSLTAGTEGTFPSYAVKFKLFYGTFASGVSANLVGTWADANSAPLLFAAAWSGVSSIANENRASGSDTSPTINITTTNGDTAVVLGVYDYLGTASGTPGTGVTEDFDNGWGAAWSGYVYEKAATTSSTTVNWTISSGGGQWGISGVTLTPGGGGPVTVAATGSACTGGTGTAAPGISIGL